MKCRIEYGTYANSPGYWFEVIDSDGYLTTTYHANQQDILFGPNGFITQIRCAHNAYGKGSLIKKS